MTDDLIEALYVQFRQRTQGCGRWEGARQIEREAFGSVIRAAVSFGRREALATLGDPEPKRSALDDLALRQFWRRVWGR